jgi:hypothetical protein
MGFEPMRTLRSTGSQGPRVNHSALGMPKQLLRHYPGADSQHQLAILSNSFPNKTFTRGTPPKYVFAFPEYQNNSENFNFGIVHIYYFTVTLICSRHSSVSKPITSNILCLFLQVRKLDKKSGDTSKFWQGLHQKNRRLGLVVVEQKRT